MHLIDLKYDLGMQSVKYFVIILSCFISLFVKFLCYNATTMIVITGLDFVYFKDLTSRI